MKNILIVVLVALLVAIVGCATPNPICRQKKAHGEMLGPVY